MTLKKLLCLILACCMLAGCEMNMVSSEESTETTIEASEKNAFVDLMSADGKNELPIGDYPTLNGKVIKGCYTASLCEEYSGLYADCAETHLSVLLRDSYGKDNLYAYLLKESEDGAVLADLLQDGLEHSVILKVRLLPDSSNDENETGSPMTARIISVISLSWSDPETAYLPIFESVVSSPSEVQALVKNGSPICAVDRNGDGLIYHAIISENYEAASILLNNGATFENHNHYYSNYDNLSEEEINDLKRTTMVMLANDEDPGCCGESLLTYFIEKGNTEAVRFIVGRNAFDPEKQELSAYETKNVAAYYGLVYSEDERANILDYAIMNGQTESVELLLDSNVECSYYLREKMLAGMDFSEDIIALLAKEKYFHELDDVLHDFDLFYDSYMDNIGNLFAFFEKANEYDALIANGEKFDAVYLVSNDIAPAMNRQNEAFDNIKEPSTVPIQILYNRLSRFNDNCNSAAEILRLVNLDINKGPRNNHLSQYAYFANLADTRYLEVQELIEYYQMLIDLK